MTFQNEIKIWQLEGHSLHENFQLSHKKTTEYIFFFFDNLIFYLLYVLFSAYWLSSVGIFAYSISENPVYKVFRERTLLPNI